MAARFCTNCGRPLTETERQFGITRCAACEASASGIPPTPAERGTLPSQPPEGETTVNLRVDYPERLSRWLLFFKWLFVIPAFIVVGLYGIAVFVTTFISFWAILFTGRYPSGLFDFARGYMALYARTAAYFPLLLTDQYPLGSDVGSTVHYEVEEPEGLSRGLLLLKLGSFLLSVVGTLTGVVAVVLFLTAIPAWFAILFTGRYPRGMFDFMVAVAQWIARVTGWQYLMRDEWSLFATTQGVGVLVGAGAVAVAVLTIFNYATGPALSGFEMGEDRPASTAIQVEDTRFRLDYFASRLTMYVDQSGGQGVVQPGDALPAVSDLLIQEEIVRRFAGQMDVTATDDEVREEIASRLGITADDESFDVVFRQELARTVISEANYRQMAEAAALADKLSQRFLSEVPQTAESVHCRQIVVSTEQEAQEMREEIEGGGDFAALAAENSLDPATKDNGGDVGWVPRGVLDASTEELLFVLEPSEITTIPTGSGVLVIEMLEKDDDHPVEEDWKEPLAGRALADWIQEKRQSLSIINNMDVLGSFDQDKVEWAVHRAYQN